MSRSFDIRSVAVTGGAGGDRPYRQDLTFAPALTPTATTIAPTSPPTIDGTTTTTITTLSPRHPPR